MDSSRSVGLLVVAGTLAVMTLWKSPREAARRAPASSGKLSFELKEAAAAAGLVNVHRKYAPHPSLLNVAPWIASLGAGIAVADVDGDGWPDVYVTNSAVGAMNRLFRNNRDGTFTDVAPSAGLADVNHGLGSMRALFFDYDNDGRKDLLLTGYGCSRLFHQDVGGRFSDATTKAGLKHCGNAVASNVVALDRSGYLSVVIADYFPVVDFLAPKTTRFMQNRLYQADNGGPVTVLRNHGGRFTLEPGKLGIRSPGWTLAVGAYDFRGTGRPDLHFATDYNTDRLYLNEGDGRFRDDSARLQKNFDRNNMNSEAADLFNDGRAHLLVTELVHPPFTVGRNMLWRWDGPREVSDVAASVSMAPCGWAWGGKFVDLDNDGYQDVVVANGYISATRGKDYWYNFSVLAGAEHNQMEDARNWRPMADSSMSGYERDCVYHNTGAALEEVTSMTGVAEDESDGRAVAVIDALNDGSLSVLVSNLGQSLKFYRNVRRNSNSWIGFALTGTRSGRDAFGAEVTVHLADGRTLRRQLQPANGFMSQSDARIHFGLGAAERIADATVLWPSGTMSIVKNPAAGVYHALVEPMGK